MDLIFEFASALCLLVGSFLCLSGGVGVLRFPDFYTRMHAVGVTDTLATALILVGLMLLRPEVLVLIKLVMIFLMILFISPSASHAVAKAALRGGLPPFLRQSDKQEGAESSKP